MASKFMKETSAEATFEKMFLPQKSEQEKGKSEPANNATSGKAPSQVSPKLPRKTTHTSAAERADITGKEPRTHRKGSATSAYEARKYYLTEELVDALAYRAYRDRSLSLSGHVRAALEKYLADDIAAIKKD